MFNNKQTDQLKTVQEMKLSIYLFLINLLFLLNYVSIRFVASVLIEFLIKNVASINKCGFSIKI